MSGKRPVDSKDFEGTAPIIRDAKQINRWGICVAGYQLRPPRQDTQRAPWLRARQPLRLTEVDGNNWKAYKPLEEHSDLFLRFARLSRKPASAERALDWCRAYGVLGLAGDYHWGWTGENIGGRYETLEGFDAEVERAAGVLALYEAALNRDYEAAEYYAFKKYPRISAELDGAGRDTLPVEEMVKTHGRGDYLIYALEASSWIVESTVRGSCYPTLRPEGSRDPSDVSGSWGFTNLRGAMYLQMYWLMGGGGNVARCKWCGGVIPLSSTLSGGSKPKPRRDKKFCDAACRQRYHYHNRIKPQITRGNSLS